MRSGGTYMHNPTRESSAQSQAGAVMSKRFAGDGVNTTHAEAIWILGTFEHQLL